MTEITKKLVVENGQLAAQVQALYQKIAEMESKSMEEKKHVKSQLDGYAAMVLSVQEHMLHVDAGANSAVTATALPA